MPILLTKKQKMQREILTLRAFVADLKEECARCRAGQRLVMPSYIEKRIARLEADIGV